MHTSQVLLKNQLRSGKIRLVPAAALAAVGLVLSALFAPAVLPNTSERGMGVARARRADFTALIVASGRIESTNNTDIRCSLERLSAGSTTTILSLVEDGTMVKEGQILAQIDSSAYQEMVRQQAINLQQVRASHRQAELDLEVANIGLESYLEGERVEADRLYRSQISLAESDKTRQADRLHWTKRMMIKGYASVLQVATDESTMLRTTLTLAQSVTAFRNHQRFTVPKTTKALESQVNAAKAALDYQTVRLKREEERMLLYQKQVENCTVRAPHDGFIVYANQQGRAPEVYEGATVRQRQRLFALPDLSKMEIQALLHETVVNRVKVGMPVTAHLEALPGLTLEGSVSAISPLPLNARKSDQGSDVTYFMGRIALDSIPKGLYPGMSTEIEIKAARRVDVLSVPHSAVALDNGRHVCTVLSGENLEHQERRYVTIGESSHELVEVIEGLSEGEFVLLDNSQSIPSPLAHTTFAEQTGSTKNGRAQAR